MTKWKQTAVLGSILLTGLLFLTSFPAAGQLSGVAPNYGMLRSACLDSAITVDGCTVLARLITRASDESLLTVAVREIGKAVKINPRTSCDSCVQATTDFEVLLATNGTSQSIVATMQEACATQYSNPTTRAECNSFIAGAVPVIIDQVLENLPPVTLCQELGNCPL